MKTSERLIAGKALIQNPENWLQGEYAQPSKDILISLYGNEAAAGCFCSVGALQRVNDTDDHVSLGHEYLNQASKHMHGLSIVQANDTLTHKEVMAIWDKAIELSKGDE